MKIRLIASVLCLILAVCAGVSGTLYTRSLCSTLAEQTQYAAEKYDSSMLCAIKQEWDSKVSLLSAFIPHEHIDELTQTLNRALSFLNNDDRNEFDAEISSMLHQFDIIGRYDIPTFRTLF